MPITSRHQRPTNPEIPTQARTRRTFRARRLLLSAAAAVGALLTGRSAWAQSADTWLGGASANWADANWSGTDITGGQTTPLSGDSLIFASAGSFGTSLNDNLTSGSFAISGITFNGPSIFSIGGNDLDLTGTITDAAGGSGTTTISDAITLGAASTLTSSAGGTLDLSGIISNSFGLTITNTFGATLLS
ncbi:MAG TPA: hypothetical protein VL992_16705, partial [Tepidisphaeraceae bacterium]|nr:hypothetical protein [Tepidisphaeraceae bacterium]